MHAYLDNNATTRPAQEVIDAMLPWLRDGWGNPSSVHALGRRARQALDAAHAAVGSLIGCDGREVCFVASGSEANALALKGGALGQASTGRRHLVVSAIEHPSVLEAARQLEAQGFQVSRVAPMRNGVVRAADFVAALRPDTVLAALMLANNETGAIQPVVEVAQACRERGVLLHVDAVQAAGKLPVSAAALQCDLLSVAGHKFHGPRGAAALFVRRGLQLAPLVAGHQERGRRGGTENVAAAVGMARACELAAHALQQMPVLAAMRDRFEEQVLAAIAGAVVNGPVERIANTSNLRFPGADGETALIGLDLAGVAVSSGAACSSGSQQPSHVLLAMGLSGAEAQASLRFSISRQTSRDELHHVLAVLPAIIAESRRASGRDQP